MATHTTKDIRDFIIQNVDANPNSIVRLVMGKFGIKRQSVHEHLQKLQEKGVIASRGETRAKEYYLKPIADETFRIKIDENAEEDKVWRMMIAPLLKGVKDNILAICHHGFTEMFNNVIDHSEAGTGIVQVIYKQNHISIDIMDEGIGIFNKIMTLCNLEDHRHAILELAKGKLTTDPKGHTGEGIFFTSRMFDRFGILSGKLYYACLRGDDWLLENKDHETKGTHVHLEISPDSKTTTEEVFNKYASGAHDYGFTKTHVPVHLAIYGNENLVSRSQAKRLLARFDRFEEVFLDFDKVEVIGNAFADEIFRVFKREHPHVKITWINANESVGKVIESVLKRIH